MKCQGHCHLSPVSHSLFHCLSLVAEKDEGIGL